VAFRALHLTLDSVFLSAPGETSRPSPIEDDLEPPDLDVPNPGYVALGVSLGVACA